MDLVNDPQTEREADRAQANREELTERIALQPLFLSCGMHS
jgi:hypothetical protein